jgi:hypothetical protein
MAFLQVLSHLVASLVHSGIGSHVLFGSELGKRLRLGSSGSSFVSGESGPVLRSGLVLGVCLFRLIFGSSAAHEYKYYDHLRRGCSSSG